MRSTKLFAVASLFFSMAFAPLMQAVTVTAIIKGTVQSGGSDTYGNVFNLGSSLGGQPFTLIYTFDDSLGSEVDPINYPCPGGGNYYSNVTGSIPSNNPGIATLQIGSGTKFPFGGAVTGYPIATSGNSYAQRNGGCGTSSAGYGVSVGYTSGGTMATAGSVMLLEAQSILTAVRF